MGHLCFATKTLWKNNLVAVLRKFLSFVHYISSVFVCINHQEWGLWQQVIVLHLAFACWRRDSKYKKIIINKKAFQQDVYRPLQWQPRGGVCPSMHWAGGCIPACTGQGECLPRVCLPGGCAQCMLGYTPTLWTEWLTDRWKNITFTNFVCGW